VTAEVQSRCTLYCHLHKNKKLFRKLKLDIRGGGPVGELDLPIATYSAIMMNRSKLLQLRVFAWPGRWKLKNYYRIFLISIVIFCLSDLCILEF
jgi:hypothetical protein